MIDDLPDLNAIEWVRVPDGIAERERKAPWTGQLAVVDLGPTDIPCPKVGDAVKIDGQMFEVLGAEKAAFWGGRVTRSVPLRVKALDADARNGS